MTTRLKRLQVDRVDLVDKGANPGAHILLFKRKGAPMAEESSVEMQALAKRLADVEAKATVDAEAFAKRLAEADAKAAAAEELAKRERSERMRVAYVAKAAAYKGLPLDPEKDYAIFEALDMLPETHKSAGERMVALLQAADEAMIQSGLLKAHGRPGGGTEHATAWGKIDTLAKSYVADGKAATHAQAVVKVLDEHSDLAQAYYAERG